MEVVPGISEIMSKTERSFGTDTVVERIDNFLTVVRAVEGRVFDGQQHVGNGVEIERICGLGQVQFPIGGDSEILEGP